MTVQEFHHVEAGVRYRISLLRDPNGFRFEWLCLEARCGLRVKGRIAAPTAECALRDARADIRTHTRLHRKVGSDRLVV